MDDICWPRRALTDVSPVTGVGWSLVSNYQCSGKRLWGESLVVDMHVNAVKEESMIKKGDKAPALVGTSYDGRTIDIGNPGRKTVLFFYPKANTSG